MRVFVKWALFAHFHVPMLVFEHLPYVFGRLFVDLSGDRDSVGNLIALALPTVVSLFHHDVFE